MLMLRPLRSRALWRDVCIASTAVVAGALLAFATAHPGSDPWDLRGVAALFVAMVVGERLAVPLPRSGAVSVVTIPHMVAVLLLPPWVAMAVAGVAMLVDQLAGRTGPRRALFNTSSIIVTVGVAALAADRIGLGGEALGRSDQWYQVPAFLVVSALYYAVTNLLVSAIVSVSSGVPIQESLHDNAGFSVPAEFAMSGIGGLIAVLWLLSPAWVPLVLFPGIISQVALTYISASKRKSEQLRYQAHHDLLTGLPNRAALVQRLEALLASRDPDPFALLLLDLDRFKEVNDTFGHQVGDLLLHEVGSRLRGALRSGDLLARLGGDEFALLLPETDDEAGLALAERLLRILDEPLTAGGQALHVGGSIGIASYPSDGDSLQDLLRRADVAMYAAKGGHAGVTVYTPGLDDDSRQQVTLYGELRRALEREELRLHFQPKVDVGTGVLSGVEALVRWQHPERGLLSPDRFVPLAERTGLIKALGQWVLEAAIRQSRAWKDQGLAIQVAVNLTARDLDDQDLPCRIVELLRCHGVPAPHLRVEITETTLMKNPEHARRVLKDLRDVGVCVAIDDFGTGYSSLAYLKRLPADELKIDKSFVRHVATDEGDAAIVRSVIALGHELGFSVTAEGVEDRASLDWLRRVGCDRAQGYFFAHPLDAAGLAAWVGSWAPNGAAPIPSGAGITSLPRVRRSRVSEAVTTSEAA